MTGPELILQQLINAVSIGSLYALMAIGLAMVFGILRLINFAHGDLIMVGSYVALLLIVLGTAFLVAAAAGIVASTLAGACSWSGWRTGPSAAPTRSRCS